MIILYCIDPISFGKTWKGRTYYIFFLWLILMEIILKWDAFKDHRIKSVKSIRGIVFLVVFWLPTLYVIAGNFLGLNNAINDLAIEQGITFASLYPEVIPLSIEYLVFAVVFALLTVLEYGTVGFRNFSVPTLFLGVIGTVYMIDNLYSAGFVPFQILVPTTASLASKMLNFIGYRTSLYLGSTMPLLIAYDQRGVSWGARIGWPCAGIDSLLIYSVTIVLFLEGVRMSMVKKVICFLVGAAITYFINILRIVSIFVIGVNGGDVWSFHDYYGPLYSITWIVTYPLIIIGCQTLWGKIENWRTDNRENKLLSNKLE
ncbi:MAG: exosortase/archaeosortase family protein [Candidatus Bathyarchaeia archaeon]